MAYWVLAILFIFVAAVLTGRADGSALIYAVALLAPVYAVIAFFAFLRSVFSRNAAISLGQFAAGIGAVAVIMAYYLIGYY